MHINLFCPVRESAPTLVHALDSHSKLEGIAERFYFDDCDDMDASDLLVTHPRIAAQGSFEGRPEYIRTSETHIWKAESMVRMATIRNTGLHAIFASTAADAVLMVDSDVIMHPKTAVHLGSLGMQVVSMVYWSQWRGWSLSLDKWRSEPWMPQVWDVHNYNYWGPDRILRLRDQGMYDVNGLGGCTLITRQAFEAGATYSYIPGLDLVGEDRHFCVRAAAAGIQLYADTTYPAFHLYRPESQTEEMVRWRDEYQCDPEYFRQTWLTREWEKQIKTKFGS